jgi:hypothetical protein
MVGLHAYKMKAEQKVKQLHFEHSELTSHQSLSFQSEVIWVYWYMIQLYKKSFWLCSIGSGSI